MLFKLRPCNKKLCPCIQKLSNVCYPPTPSLGWIGQIKDRLLSLAIVHKPMPTHYNMEPMPTHEQKYRTHAHPKPMGVGAHCRSLVCRQEYLQSVFCVFEESGAPTLRAFLRRGISECWFFFLKIGTTCSMLGLYFPSQIFVNQSS